MTDAKENPLTIVSNLVVVGLLAAAALVGKRLFTRLLGSQRELGRSLTLLHETVSSSGECSSHGTSRSDPVQSKHCEVPRDPQSSLPIQK